MQLLFTIEKVQNDKDRLRVACVTVK